MRRTTLFALCAAAGLTVVLVQWVSWTARCLIGTPAQNAVDVQAYGPEFMAAFARAYSGREAIGWPQDKVLDGLTTAWAGLKACSRAQGLNQCQAVGTHSELQVRDADKGGADGEAADALRYRIDPADSEWIFALLFWPQGSGAFEWTQVTIWLYGDDSRLKIVSQMEWWNCVERVSPQNIHYVVFRKEEINDL